MAINKLTAQEIRESLAELPGWQLDGPAIKKEWQFVNFARALEFINKVGRLAEQMGHHPELFNVYHRVVLRFTTHDAGGLTAMNFRIAKDVDKLM